MIWIIGTTIGVVAFAICALIGFVDTALGRVLHGVWVVPVSAVFGVLFGVLLSILAGFVAAPIIPRQDVEISETPICTVTDSSEYEGHFALGTGYATSGMKIYYVTEKDGRKEICSADSKDVTIVETDTEQPKAVVTASMYKHGWVNFFFIDVRSVFTEEFGGQAVTLTVPKDTITVQYNIDFK